MEDTSFTIQELVDLSGVPRRNIYFYAQQGILPPPQGAGPSGARQRSSPTGGRAKGMAAQRHVSSTSGYPFTSP